MSNLAQNSDDEQTQTMSLLSLDETSEETSAIVEEESEETSEEENIDYSTLTVSELKNLCKERGLTGYSSYTKSELIELLTESEGL